MKHLNFIFISVVVFFVIVGCATVHYTVGKDFNSDSVNKIVKGKTTTDELQQMFGYPFTKTVLSENEEKWIYTYSDITAKATSNLITTTSKATGLQKTLDILIKDGVVINFTYNEGPMDSTIKM